MVKHCVKKWNDNKDNLEKKLRKVSGWNSCDYKDLVALIVEQILNNGEEDGKWNTGAITEIDNGDYQGTILFLIPRNTYQPFEGDYLMTYVGYGSCSGCDTLLSIQDFSDELLTDRQVRDFMMLCKDIVVNMILPYNTGWRHSDEFDPCDTKTEFLV